MMHHRPAPTVNLSLDTPEKPPDSTTYGVRDIPPGTDEKQTQLLEFVSAAEFSGLCRCIYALHINRIIFTICYLNHIAIMKYNEIIF
jgi:hypothetical protein